MESLSRRAFLRGRNIPTTPWGNFCQRIRRTTTGEFYEYDEHNGINSARLSINSSADIYHVLSLCNEYQVQIALHALDYASPIQRNTLWLEIGDGLSGAQLLNPEENLWFVQPGCTAGQLVELGLEQFSLIPSYTTIAHWLADRSLSEFPMGQTHLSGVVHASVILSDGENVTLGPFGDNNTKPLDGMRLQNMITSMFTLASGFGARTLLRHPFWPLRYRVDALMKINNQEINLAHLLLGHGGDLAWVDWIVIDADQLQLNAMNQAKYSSKQINFSDGNEQVDILNQQIKALFDVNNVFTSKGQDI